MSDDYYGNSRAAAHFGRYYASDQPPASPPRSWLWTLLLVACVIALYVVIMLCWFGSTT